MCWSIKVSLLLLSCFGLSVSSYGPLPDFAITNIDVEHIEDDWVEFDRFRKGSDDKALILADIEETGRKLAFGWGIVPIYRGRIVNETAIVEKLETDIYQEEVILYMHGFNVPPGDVMEKCAEYTRDYNRLVIPLIWAVEDSSIAGYHTDRILNAPTAAECFRDKLHIIKDVPKSLLCHSMGNYVLRLAARTCTENESPFNHIFMVAADVAHDIFDVSPNSHANHTLNDGLEIASMSKKNIHVLYSSNDVAMQLRTFHPATWGIQGLGLEGYREENLHPDLIDQLLQCDCSEWSGDDDWLFHHGYAFTADSIAYYESLFEK